MTILKKSDIIHQRKNIFIAFKRLFILVFFGLIIEKITRMCLLFLILLKNKY